MTINPSKGFWWYKNHPYIKTGYYHTECGSMGGSKKKSTEMPF